MSNNSPSMQPLFFQDSSGLSGLQRRDGLLQKSDDGGQSWGSFGVPGDAEAQFKQRADSIMPLGHHARFFDFLGAPTDVTSSGYAATSSGATQTTGRSGGGKIRYQSSGAAGFHFGALNTQDVAGSAVVTANMSWEPWYIEGEVRLTAITGAAEIGICGLFDSTVGFGNTDGASGAYIMLGFRPATSAGFLVLWCWDGITINPVITSMPVEVAQQRLYSVRNDGLGTLTVYRDGVQMGAGVNMFNTLGNRVGASTWYIRSLSGTTDHVVDSVGFSGMSR